MTKNSMNVAISLQIYHDDFTPVRKYSPELKTARPDPERADEKLLLDKKGSGISTVKIMDLTVDLGSVAYYSETRIKISFEPFDRHRQRLTIWQMIDDGLNPGKINHLV